MVFNKKKSHGGAKKNRRGCVSRAELSMALLFVFLNTNASQSFAWTKNLRWQISFRDGKNWARECVWRPKNNIYVRTQSSPGNQLTKPSLHEMQRADKLLNALRLLIRAARITSSSFLKSTFLSYLLLNCWSPLWKQLSVWLLPSLHLILSKRKKKTLKEKLLKISLKRKINKISFTKIPTKQDGRGLPKLCFQQMI